MRYGHSFACGLHSAQITFPSQMTSVSLKRHACCSGKSDKAGGNCTTIRYLSELLASLRLSGPVYSGYPSQMHPHWPHIIGFWRRGRVSDFMITSFTTSVCFCILNRKVNKLLFSNIAYLNFNLTNTTFWAGGSVILVQCCTCVNKRGMQQY